jgi:hypothetical protein
MQRRERESEREKSKIPQHRFTRFTLDADEEKNSKKNFFVLYNRFGRKKK